MADWLVHFLIQIGGTAALLAVAGFAVGKWLWGKIDKALESYTSAYAQEAARIDARIGHLEKLAEEQARLTRTVESIKDEIGAQRKMHDNRWEFRKDVYVRLITSVVALIDVHSRMLSFRTTPIQGSKDEIDRANALLEKTYLNFMDKTAEFNLAASLVGIATADTILLPLNKATSFQLPLPTSPEFDAALRDRINNLSQFLAQLHFASRKDLWGTPEPTVNPQALTQQT